MGSCLFNEIVDILIVDDDELLRRSLAFSLEQVGFKTITAASAEDALDIVKQNRPDLIILDIMLPGMDGMEALKQFRENMGIPVIFLTARRREIDQVIGLELGADDFLSKPFNPDVLIARIHAVLRRTSFQPVNEGQPLPVKVGDLEIDPSARTVSLAGKAVLLTPKEFEILLTLASEPKRVFSIENLLARAWGAEYLGEPQIVYVHIRWLREKIEQDPQHPARIITVRGAGYKLIPS